MDVQYDLSYDLNKNNRVFDLFRPAGDPAPLILMLHGGGWISGDQSMYHEEAAWFTEQGFACATVGYSLAPLSTFPAPVADVQTMLTYARDNAEALGIDKDRIFSFGNSAGGHLSAMLGACTAHLESGEQIQPVDAAVAICPITDLRKPHESHFPIAFSFIEQFMGTFYDDDIATWEKASPVTHLTETTPPFLLFHGSDDDVVPVTQSRQFHAALIQHGTPSEYYELTGEGHSFTLAAWTQIREQTVEFLRTV